MKGLFLLLWVVAVVWTGHGADVLSGLSPGQPSPAGGAGDSMAPVVSPDGRFVAFASTADNLVSPTNVATFSSSKFPPCLNVLLRDRARQTTTLISVNASGTAGGNGDSMPVEVSADGRYVLFESQASDLVPGDANQAADIFVRDVVSNLTVLVSVNTNGGAGNGPSRSPAMTPDARYVTFVSSASNLVPGDANAIPDVFVRDLQAGLTTLVSVGAKPRLGSAVSRGGSESPEITPDGGYIAFYSSATNLVPGVPANGDIYVRDLVAGVTTWASSGARAAALTALRTTNVASYNHALSADGQYVAFECSPVTGSLYAGLILRYQRGSGVTDVAHTNAAVPLAAFSEIHNLDLTPDGRYLAFIANTNGNTSTTTCACVWDAATELVTLVSGDLSGGVTGNSFCDWPKLDPSGRFVTFLSSAANLVTNNLPAGFHLYLRDLQSNTMWLVDRDLNGAGSFLTAATVPCMTTNGQWVVFEAGDGAMVPNDRNRDSDVFFRDWAAGSAELISLHDPALPSQSPNGSSTLGNASFSGNGHWVVFASEADNLVSNDTNRCRDVFIRDLGNGALTLVSVATNGFSGLYASSEPSISTDGGWVAFTSNGDDLVNGDTNNVSDVFLRDLEHGTTTLVSANWMGTGPGDRASYSPVVAGGGRYVLFRSLASTLVFGTPTSKENVFLYDRVRRTNWAMTMAGAGPAAITPDGRFVVCAGSNAPPPLLIWDVVAERAAFSNLLAGAASVFGVAIAANGQRAAYSTSSGLYLVDVQTGAVTPVMTNGAPVCTSLCFDAPGRLLGCALSPGSNVARQIVVFDLDNGSSTLVSTRSGTAEPGNGDSDSPTIHPDGRFVAYRSAASNLVAGDTNGVPDLFLYDRLTGTNIPLTAGPGGGGNGRSLAPMFTADGSMLLFQSWASDLTPGDHNHSQDLFACLFLNAAISFGNATDPLPRVSWPWLWLHQYGVEYKSRLSDPQWQTLTGTITNSEGRGWLEDSAPDALLRFYRVIAY